MGPLVRTLGGKCVQPLCFKMKFCIAYGEVALTTVQEQELTENQAMRRQGQFLSLQSMGLELTTYLPSGAWNWCLLS